MCRHKLWKGLGFIVLLAILGVFISPFSLAKVSVAYSESLTPTPDRLAEPVLPEDPTQYELGRHLYWLNCMPCHGDMGQGLTDEFRSLWVEDHQDCWESGCHGGRAEDQGFPLPRTIPAIIFATGNLPTYSTTGDLFEYLRTTHPPQRPGKLTEDEYWAVTAYVLTENKRLPPGQVVGHWVEALSPVMILEFTATGFLLLTVSSIIICIYRRRKSLNS